MVVAVTMRMAFLHEPFDRDEGWYATIAQIILDGGIPYRDAIEQKPPGVFYIYAVAIALFGTTVESIRIFTAAYSLATLIAVYFLARLLLNPFSGLFAAAIFALFSCAPKLQGSGSNSEVFLVLPILLSTICFVCGHQKQSRRLLAASGFFAGTALMIKTVALPYMLLLIVSAVFFTKGRQSLKNRIENIAIFLIPPLCLFIFVSAFFYLNGALHEFMYWNISVPYLYLQGKSGVEGSPLMPVLNALAHELMLPFILSAATTAWLLLAKRELKYILTALFLPASCVAVLLPGNNFSHYFILLMPFMSVLSGIGMGYLFAQKKFLFWSVTPLLVLLFSNYLRTDFDYFITMPVNQVSMSKFGPVFVDSVAIAHYLKERTNPNDFIFQWGFEPEIYFLSDRRSPLPYISSTIIEVLKDREGAIRHMMVTLLTKKPKYIVYQAEWAEFAGADDIRLLLKLQYFHEATIGYGEIFRLKGS